MSITLLTIKNRVADRLHDVDDVETRQWYNWGTDLNNFLYSEIKSVDPERFIVAQIYVASAGNLTQVLPTNFRDIQEDGCGFFLRDASGKDTSFKLPITGFASNQLGYYLSGGNVVFTGISSSTTIVLRYIPPIAKITAFSGVNGVFCVPDENEELLELGMVLRYYRDEEDPSVTTAEQDFIRALAVFLAKYKKAPNIWTFSTSLNRGA